MAISAPRDANRVPVLVGTSNADGTTPILAYVDSSTNRLLVQATISGSFSVTIASDGTTGSAVPASANYKGINVAGNLRGQTGVNPSGSIYAAQMDLASVAGATVVTGNGTASGAIRVALPTDGTGVVGLIAGSAIVGKVGIDQTTPGTTNAVSLAQVGSTTVATGNGVVGTGVQRVAIASDNTAFSVNATLSAETTKVIGTVRNLGNIGAVFDGVVTAASSPANGIMGLGIYNSTEPSPTTGQSVGIQLDSKGRQRMVIYDAAGNTRGVNVNASNQMSVSIDAVAATNISTNIAQMNGVTVTMGNGVAGTGVQRVAIASDNTVLPGVGAGATGSAVPVNASYAGSIAKTALPTAATDANLVGQMADKFGRQVTLPITIRDLTGTQTTTLSASTSETTIVTAGGAGVFNDLIMLVVSNTSASTQTRIDFRDTTSGSVLFSLNSPGNSTIGFGSGVAIPQTSANTNWTAQCSASTTDVRIYAVFAKNK